MKHNKITPKSELIESPISPRFSLADKDTGREDSVFTDGYLTQRVVTYPTPRDPNIVQASAWLNEGGYVWGQPLESRDPAVTRYHIPSGIRPLSHDSKGSVATDLVYGDSELFFDIGKLLGCIAKAGPESPLAVYREIGKTIALKEFSRVNEPVVLLVPGFEHSIAPVESDDQAFQHYTVQLGQEFPIQFEQNAESFEEGFKTGIS